MTDDKTNESAIVPVDNETKALVEREMPEASDEVKQKVVELIEAIKRRAQSEVEAAGNSTREAYLVAVKQAEEAIAKTQETSEKYRDELEKSLKIIEQEAHTNWDKLVQEMTGFGDRLRQAADAAWSVLTAPKPPADSASNTPNEIEIGDE
jgi:uncharacterized protein YjbJ (UPF0337 family)